MRKPSRKSLIGAGAIGGVLLISLLVEAPPRSLSADERIPDRIVIRQHPKFGDREPVTLTNREEILSVMTALPVRYRRQYCKCFGEYDLEFYASAELYRTVNYKPGDYLRDSEQYTGQASVPRRFKRIVGGMLAQHE